jgi:DNA-binding transcriptional LysR family regulator
MNIDQLIVFKEIVEHGTLRAAATKLGRTQPALSASLKQLEAKLGFKLFSRQSYRPSLTGEGTRFLKGLDSFMLELEKLHELAADIKGGHEASLCIALDSACPFEWVIPQIQKSLECYPTLELNLQFGVLTQSVDRVLRNEADLALSPIFVPFEEIESRPLLKRRLVAVIHRCLLEDPAQNLSLAQLKKIPNIVVHSGNKKNPLGIAGLRGGKSFTVSNHAIKEQLILKGLGWGRIPEERLLEEKELVPLKYKEMPPIELQIEVLWKKGRILGPAARKVRDSLEQFFLNA